jgi:sorbitol/mannitol transport system permease protein
MTAAPSQVGVFRPSVAPAPKPRGISAWRKFLSSPAILFLIVITQLPLVFTLHYSTLRWNLQRPDNIAPIGLRNYERVLTDDETWSILGNTLTLTLSVVVLTFLLGLMLALLLNREFAGKGLVRTLLITPFLIMPTVSAVLWKNVLYNPTVGFFAAISSALGLARFDFLGNAPMASLIAVLVWQWTPFMMLILLAGLQSLPREPVEAASIDGAGPVGLFRFVILPHLTRYIEIAVLLEVLFILSVFGEIFVLTTGGPGIATTNLAFDVYLEGFTRWNIGLSSALGVLAIVLANIVVLLFIRVLRRGSQREDA